jgi:hypothetical protein
VLEANAGRCWYVSGDERSVKAVMDCLVDDDDPVSSLEHNMARKRKSYSIFKIDF